MGSEHSNKNPNITNVIPSRVPTRFLVVLDGSLDKPRDEQPHVQSQDHLVKRGPGGLLVNIGYIIKYGSKCTVKLEGRKCGTARDIWGHGPERGPESEQRKCSGKQGWPRMDKEGASCIFDSSG